MGQLQTKRGAGTSDGVLGAARRGGPSRVDYATTQGAIRQAGPALPRWPPAFVFLASDESRYVNGEVLGVTGGQLLG
jgi:NAD(P)-dependent dehydrogenase (short-subunit alcohol dehydrogenase family)